MKQLILVFTLLWATPAIANAQETRSIELDYNTNAQPCPRVPTAGLSTAVGVSSLGVVASIPVIATSDYANSTGMLAGGITLAVLSAAGLITSAVYLKRKKDKRRRYQRGLCEAPIVFTPGLRF